MAAIINTFAAAATFAVAFTARIAQVQPSPAAWAWFVDGLAEQSEAVHNAVAGMSRPGRSGWKARRQADLVICVLEAQYAKALWAGEEWCAKLMLNTDPNAEVYAAAWMAAWVKVAFEPGAVSYADIQARGALMDEQTKGWIAKVDAGVPVIRDGLALLGVAVAYAAWLELGPALQAEARGWIGITPRSCNLRDTRVLVGGERRQVGNFIASTWEMVEFWAGMVPVLERNGVLDAHSEQARKGYGLKDVNTVHHNCGHFPQYEVCTGGTFASRAEAQAEAGRRNDNVKASWQAHIQG